MTCAKTPRCPAAACRGWRSQWAIYGRAVTVAHSIALFVLAALAEIGGAWLVWQGVREHQGWIWIGAPSTSR
jgi:hypothetical protein